MCAALPSLVVSCLRISLMLDVNFLFIRFKLRRRHLCPMDTFSSKFFIWFWLVFFFFKDFSQWELSELFQPIFSVSYCFLDTRGPKGQTHDIWGHMKFLFFNQFWWGFFIGFLSMISFKTVAADFLFPLLFSRYKGQKGKNTIFSWMQSYCQTYHFSKNTLLCPIYYCVKHMIVSSKY